MPSPILRRRVAPPSPFKAGANLSESRAQTEEAEEGTKYSASFRLESRKLLTKRRSIRRIWKDGPGDDAKSEQV